MPTISFQCYSCNQVLRVGADKAGKKARCPKCATSLTIPITSAAPMPAAPTASGAFPSLELEDAPAPPPKKSGPPPLPRPASTPPARQPLRVELVNEDEPVTAAPLLPPPPRHASRQDFEEIDELPLVNEPNEDFEPAPRGRRGHQEPPPWSFVRLGFLLAFIGSCVWAGAFALKLLGYLMLSVDIIQGMTGGRGQGSGDASAILLRLGEVLTLGGSLTALVGYVFFILGPKDRGKLGLAIAVTAVAGFQVLLLLLVRLPFIFGNQLFANNFGFGIWFLLLLSQLLFVAELVLVPIYIRQVAAGFRRSGHGRTALQTIFVTGAYGGLRLLLFIMVYVTYTALLNPSRGGSPQALFWICLTLLWFGNFAYTGQVIWYTIYLWKSRELVPVNGGR